MIHLDLLRYLKFLLVARYACVGAELLKQTGLFASAPIMKGHRKGPTYLFYYEQAKRLKLRHKMRISESENCYRSK